MSVLTDAEYAQLSPAEQAQYWRRRYYDLEAERDDLQDRVADLSSLMRTIREAAEQAKRLR